MSTNSNACVEVGACASHSPAQAGWGRVWHGGCLGFGRGWWREEVNAVGMRRGGEPTQRAVIPSHSHDPAFGQRETWGVASRYEPHGGPSRHPTAV
eukprot:scaffold10709_cov90-Isochrysis_galbana.AAC.2